MNAPVTALVDGNLKIIPMWPLKTCKDWKDVIIFDSYKNLFDKLVADAYTLKVWARTGVALSAIPQLKDPNDLSCTLPHGAILGFQCIPICLFPGPICTSLVVLSWSSNT